MSLISLHTLEKHGSDKISVRGDTNRGGKIVPKIFFIISLLIVVEHCNAQPQSSYWYFGDRAGLHFNNNLAECDTNNVMSAIGECATISDSLGNLLFYTQGTRVWNRLGEYMPHGDSIFYQGEMNWGNPDIFGWEQDGVGSWGGVNILPVGNNKYYVFLAIYKSYQGTSDSVFIGPGYYWYLVDMNLNGGMGDVVGLTNHFGFPSNSTLGCVRHANGRDWWVIGQTISDTINTITEFLVSPFGITGPYYLNIGQKPAGAVYGTGGQIIFSSDGSKMLHTTMMGITELFDFNRCSGELSNKVDLTIDSTVTSNWLWEQFTLGCSISPNGEVLYLNTSKYLIQMFSPNNDNIYLKDTIWSNPFYNSGSCSCPVLTSQMLGPDGKIYISNGSQLQPELDSAIYQYTTSISVINSPDSIGQACNFQPFSVSTCGRKLIWSLPYMPNWNLGPIDGSECDTLGIDNGIAEHNKNAEELKVYPNPADDEITIEVLRQAQHDIRSIEIINSLGVTVMKLKQTKPNQQLNIKALAAGVYFIKVQMQNGDVQVRKFIKE